jgi:hypothetical protein
VRKRGVIRNYQYKPSTRQAEMAAPIETARKRNYT